MKYRILCALAALLALAVHPACAETQVKIENQLFGEAAHLLVAEKIDKQGLFPEDIRGDFTITCEGEEYMVFDGSGFYFV